jgi:hypothetical protein
MDRLKKLLILNEDPKLAVFQELESLGEKLEALQSVLSDINVKEVKTYEEELKTLQEAILSLREALDGKDMVVNINLDNLSNQLVKVEQAIKNIKEVKIPEVKFPTEYPLSEIQINELLLAIQSIPEFPIDDLKSMVVNLEKAIKEIKIEIPEQEKLDYEFLDDKFRSLEKAVKNVSITMSGGGGGIGDRANENLDTIKTNTTGLATEDTLQQVADQTQILLQIANFLASINSTRGIAADLRTTVLSLPTLGAVTTLSNQTSMGGYTASAMVQNSQNSVAIQSNINNVAFN